VHRALAENLTDPPAQILINRVNQTRSLILDTQRGLNNGAKTVSGLSAMYTRMPAPRQFVDIRLTAKKSSTSNFIRMVL
jgi:hypothetical protein